MTRVGDEVHLSWRQMTMILAACILPAIGFAGFLYHQSERTTVLETRQVYFDQNLDKIVQRLASIEARDGMLQRLDQRLNDVDRQLTEIKQAVRHTP